MSQHDMDIATADANTGILVRAAINSALQALASSNSGATAPSTSYANQLWADTANSLLKIRNTANDAWITIGDLSTTGLALLAKSGGTLSGVLNLASALNEASDTIAAHATTCDIWSKPNNVILSGAVVTFTDLADAPQAGAVRWVKSNAAHVLTNNANLVVQSAANVTLAAGDWFRVEAITTSTFNILVFKADGTALAGGSGAASQAEMEAATDDTKSVTPVKVKYSPSAAKAWIKIIYDGGTPTINASYGIASITDTGTGVVTLTFTTAMSSANYCVVCEKVEDTQMGFGMVSKDYAAETVAIDIRNDAGGAADLPFCVAVFGDI